MSEFLAETLQSPTSQGAALIPSAPSGQATEQDIALMQRVLTAAAQNPTMIPDTLLQYVLDWLQVNNLQIPIGQVFGFQRFVSTQVTVYTSTGTNGWSHTFAAGDPATSSPGPSIALGPAGLYVMLASVDITADVSVVNGVGWNVGSGGIVVLGGSLGGSSHSRSIQLSVGSDGETVTSAFDAGPNTASSSRGVTFANAEIIAIRYDNA